MLSSKLIILGIICITTKSDKPSTEKTIGTETTQGTEATDSSTIEPLNVTAPSCENNDMNCTHLNTTETFPKNNNNITKANSTDENVKNKKQQTSKYSANNNICTCNLQAYFCDINCCCDPECSANDKTIFKYCEIDDNSFSDDRYCNYVKHIYVNNTPFEWEVNQEGLFCVITRNLPESHLVQKETPISSLEALKSRVLFWHQDVDLYWKKKLQLGLKNYAFGDPIITVKNDSSIDHLRLPRNLLTQPCIFNEDVAFLKDLKNSCSQVIIDEDNVRLSFSSFFQDFKLIRNPKLVNLTRGNFFHTCPKNVCIEIEPKLCDAHLTNCSKLENITNIKFQCSFDLKNNLNSCQNAARKIHYKLYHNGTDGLHKVEVLGVISNFSYYHFGGEDFQFIQEFSLEFLWINQTKNYSQIFSGNPGYVVGKPILMGIELAEGNGTFIVRNSSDFIDNFLVFPENINGKCVRNKTNHFPLEFGYNLMTKCRTEKTLSFNIKHNNATNMCMIIQETVFDLWGVPRQVNGRSLIFGLFGNAAPAAQEDWNEVLYTTQPKIFLNQTQGNITNKNTTLTCYNFSTLFNADIFYSRINLKTVLNQNKILGINFSFGNVRNQSFLLRIRQNTSVNVDVSFEVVSRASFFDITSERARKFVDPPSFDIRLPYDFFYPFIKIGGGAKVVMPNTVLAIVLIFVLECIF